MTATHSRETVRMLIERIADQFTAADLYFGHGTERAIDEGAWLVGHVLGLHPDVLADHLDEHPRAPQVTAVDDLVQKRIRTRKPLAYLLREAWFAGQRFYVDERVLVPRSLTAEFIIDRFAPWIAGNRVHRVLDLCTGSGCMAIAVGYSFPRARIDAVDLSPDALAVAQINVEQHRMGGHIRLIESDLFAELAGERYDVILTNPPYVAEHELPGLPPEYAHEPAIALAAGAEGLDVVTRILREAAAHLTEGGILIAEVGNSQHALSERFPQVSFTWLATAADDDSVFLLTAEQLKVLHLASSPTAATQ